MKLSLKSLGFIPLFLSLTAAASTTVSIYQPEPSSVMPSNFWTTFAGAAASSRGIEEVKYYLNGSLYCTLKQAPYNCGYKSPASGSYTLRMVARGYDGTIAEKSVSFTVGTTPATTPPPSISVITPGLTLYSPENGRVFDPGFWTTLSSGATNAVSVKYFANGVSVCTKSSAPFNCSYKTPPTGPVTINAVATSSSGHTVEKSVTISIKGAVTPAPVTNGPIVTPAISLYSPENGRVFDPNFWTTLSSGATNAVSVQYFANGVAVCTKSSAPFNCSYKTPASGSVTIKAIATSSSGHTAEKSVLISVKGTPSQPQPEPSPDTGGNLPGYTLYFQDEFDDKFNGAPDHRFWDYDINYVRNDEAQCYTDNRRENVRVENRNIEGSLNGYLVLELKKEPWTCKQGGNRAYSYTSGAITTRKRGWAEHLVDMPHGRYEIRAKIPSGRGTWPAIWLLGSSTLGSWPNSGEIDIMEAVGYEEAAGKYVLHSTLHRNSKFGWPNKWGTTGQGMHAVLTEPPSARFHTWVLEWTPDSLEFFVDGKRVTKLLVAGDLYEERLGFFRSEFAGTETALGWPYSRQTPGHKWELILNLAWGGGWGGVKGLDDSIFSNGKKVEMLVDYVRVYKKNP